MATKSKVSMLVNNPTSEPVRSTFTMLKVVDCTLLNIRQHPSFNSKVVKVVTHEEGLKAMEYEAGKEWLRVSTMSGVYGYVSGKYVVEVKDE